MQHLIAFFSPNFTNSFVAVKRRRSRKLIDSSRFAHISLPVKHLHFKRSKPVHLRLALKAALFSGDFKRIVCSFKQHKLMLNKLTEQEENGRNMRL